MSLIQMILYLLCTNNPVDIACPCCLEAAMMCQTRHQTTCKGSYVIAGISVSFSAISFITMMLILLVEPKGVGVVASVAYALVSISKLTVVDGLLLIGLNTKDSKMILPWLIVTFLTIILVPAAGIAFAVYLAVQANLGNRIVHGLGNQGWITFISVAASGITGMIIYYCWKVMKHEWTNIRALEMERTIDSQNGSCNQNGSFEQPTEGLSTVPPLPPSISVQIQSEPYETPPPKYCDLYPWDLS